jgi:hypothetical protein
MAYNQTERTINGYQVGGTLQISIDAASHRVTESGIDPSGLGRWCWTRYRGKAGKTLRVVTIYRPANNAVAAPSTVAAQHRRYYDGIHQSGEPRSIILAELGACIRTWQQQGDQLVIMGDFNESTNSDNITQYFDEFGLTDALTLMHPTSQPSPTYNRGINPIEGIFISATVRTHYGGYLPFGLFPSDHRCIWIDIDIDATLGALPDGMTVPQARRLKCEDPALVQKFLNTYEDQLQQHNLINRAFSLQSRLTVPITFDDQREFEAIDHLRIQCMLRAEHSCRKLKMGAVQWSPLLQATKDRIALWKAAMSMKRRTQINGRSLRRLERKAGILHTQQFTIIEMQTFLSEAFSEYYSIKKDAKNIRLTWLEGLALRREESMPNAGNQYKQLIRKEKQRQAARRVKSVLQKSNRGSLTMIETKDADGSWVEQTDQTNIERGCMESNFEKYTQTNTTPIMQSGLIASIGFLGENETAKEILEGRYTPPMEQDQYTTELLQQLRQVPQLTQMEPIITTEAFKEGWRKMKETTSAGKSGMHFGHMKACTQSDQVADFEATMTHIPYVTGYSPLRWKSGVDVMILKKAQQFRVDKLRTIVLLEADFNFNNKILGKEGMRTAEINNALAPEQYGSRTGHSSIDHAIHKRLVYDLLRQRRSPGIMCSNDAKSCYDRIIHAIASLALQRAGIPLPSIISMFTTIGQLNHYIRTAFGDSQECFTGHGLHIPLQGVLQGNGASPTIWVIISSPLLNMLRAANNGLFLQSSIAREHSHIVGFAFVDDTDLPTADFRQDNITIGDIFRKMQDGIDRWEGGLKATGGAIVPEKSWAYPISFNWKPSGQWYYESIDDIDMDLSVKDEYGHRQPLEMVEPHVGNVISE